MVKLLLKRFGSYVNAITGTLYLDGYFLCNTLEPLSTAKHPCIPAGCYSVVLYDSPRFKEKVPLLLNVPGRSGIEIHVGNYHTQTRGCILVGDNLCFNRKSGFAFLMDSRDSFERLMSRLLAKYNDDKLEIEIIDSFSHAE